MGCAVLAGHSTGLGSGLQICWAEALGGGGAVGVRIGFDKGERSVVSLFGKRSVLERANRHDPPPIAVFCPR